MFWLFHIHFVHCHSKHNGISQLKQCKYPAVLPHLTDTASYLTAYMNIFITEFNLTYYVEILLTLGGAVCRQRPELCVTVGYMNLCVDRDLNCG